MTITGPVLRVAFFGGVYTIAGLAFGALAGQAASHDAVVAWRWAAWFVSALVFGAHIVYEQVWLRTSPKITALHVSSAAALGAFGLAIAANVYAQTVQPQQHSLTLALALAIWPLAIALPAFVAALVSAIVLARVRRDV